MSDDDEKQLPTGVSTGGSSKTVIALIEKLSPVATHIAKGKVAAMGIRVEGEAAAMLTKMDGMIAASEKARRAGYRILWKEGNIESIARLAEEYMSPDGREEKAKNLNQDWAVSFADECENTSDKDMQVRWAKILAGEVDNPGTFSKKTLSVLRYMGKRDAELFTSFCQFVWNEIGATAEKYSIPLIYDILDTTYTDKKINLDALEHLSTLGLITHSGALNYTRTTIPLTQDDIIQPDIIMCYYDEVVVVSRKIKDGSPTMIVGKCLLTKSGHELFRICGAQKNDDFFNYVINIWKKGEYNPVIQDPAASKENN